MRAVLFDLGGTVWEPFGDLSREQVVEEAAKEAARSLPARIFEGLNPGAASRLRDRFESELVRVLSTPQPAREMALERGDFSHESFAEIPLGQMVEKAFRETFPRDPGGCPDCALTLGHALTRHSRTYPESVQVLTETRELFPHARIGIVSNTVIQPEVIGYYLREFGLDRHLDFCVCSSSAGWRKPHPAIYALALHEAGVRAHEAVFVGDRVFEDLSAPRRLGMKAILVRRGSFLGEDPRANAVAYGLEPVPGLLRRFTLGL